jgi:aquaporin Z
MRRTLRPLAAEFLGTFAFVFIGAGAVVIDAARGSVLGLVGIALAHGVGMGVLITATMRISGGHHNPAVTFAVWLSGRIAPKQAGLYVITQLLAGAAAALAIKTLLPPMAGQALSYGVPRIASDLSLINAIWIEALLTLILVSAVFGTAISPDAPKVGGFGVGLAIFVDTLVGGPLTGAAMNPARAFGPALVANDWHGHAVYWIGPLVGGLAAAVLWGRVLLPREGDK